MGIQSNPIIQRAYALSPTPLQSAAVSVLGARIRHRRYNNSFHKFTQEYIKRQWRDKSFWIRHQNEKLTDIIKLARETTNHYQDLPAEFEIDRDRPPEVQMDGLPFLYG